MKKINFVLVAVVFCVFGVWGCFPELPKWDFTCQIDEDCPLRRTICDKGLCIEGARKEAREESPGAEVKLERPQKEASQEFSPEESLSSDAGEELVSEPRSEEPLPDAGPDMVPEISSEPAPEPEVEGQVEAPPEPQKCSNIGELRLCNVPGALGECRSGNQRCNADGYWAEWEGGRCRRNLRQWKRR